MFINEGGYMKVDDEISILFCIFDPSKKEITIDRFRKIFALSNKEESNKLFSTQNIEKDRDICKSIRSILNSLNLSERTLRSSILVQENEKPSIEYKTSRTPLVNKDFEISNLSKDSRTNTQINKLKYFFEYEYLNYLTTSEIKYGFNLFGVFPSLTESSMIIRKYDSSNILR